MDRRMEMTHSIATMATSQHWPLHYNLPSLFFTCLNKAQNKKQKEGRQAISLQKKQD